MLFIMSTFVIACLSHPMFHASSPLAVSAFAIHRTLPGAAFFSSGDGNDSRSHADQYRYRSRNTIARKTRSSLSGVFFVTLKVANIQAEDLLEAATAPPAPEIAAQDKLTRPVKPRTSFSTWKLRLVTKEDNFGLHKISGIGQTLSAIGILATGASNGYQELPNSLEPMTITFCLSVLVQCISAFELAISHRKREVGVRNVFMNMGISCLIIAISALWLAPFSPEFFNDPLISKGTFAVLSLIGIIVGLDSFVNFGDLIETQIHQDMKGTTGKWARAAITTVPYMFTVPINMVVLFSIGFEYDRLSFLDLLHSGAVGMNDASMYYESIVSAVGISYMALYVTLRDKKLISKDMELVLTSITAFVVLNINLEQSKVLLTHFFL